MPYITSDRVKEIRNAIKKALPQFKFSVTCQHGSTIKVCILSGPIRMTDKPDGYVQVNEFYIRDHYQNTPEIMEVLLKVYGIMNAGNYTQYESADYGSIPSFYCNLNIGQWDKPFIYTGAENNPVPFGMEAISSPIPQTA
jgi:hypothetical protein